MIVRASRSIAALAALLALVPGPAVAADIDPGRLPGVGDAGQVIVVTAKSTRTSYATLRAFERTAEGWQEVIAATPARLGSTGLIAADRRRQGTGKTPAGTFAITSAFGRAANPGTRLDYLRVDRDDAWTYNPKDPATYNILQTAPRSWSSYGIYVEDLWGHGAQYDFVAVLDYNLPKGPITVGADGIRRTDAPADVRRGGGIFLHVSNGKSTAGCVSIPGDTMRQVLTWLDPAQRPVIVVGSDRWLGISRQG